MDDGNSLKLKEIGNRIRAARVEQHMSQDALAFEADLSLSTMSDIELGKSNLRVVLPETQDALKVSVEIAGSPSCRPVRSNLPDPAEIHPARGEKSFA